MKVRALVVAVLVLGALPSAAAASTYTVPVSRDCAITSSNSGCTGSSLRVGLVPVKRYVCSDVCSWQTFWELSNALLQFDVAGAVPAGATITDAQLDLRLNAGGLRFPATAHGITHAWDDSVTWTSPWSHAGGDFGPAESATTPATAGNHYRWDVTALVRRWLAGTQANDGVMVRPSDNEMDLRESAAFDASEVTDPARRPVLVIHTADTTPPAIDLSGSLPLAAYTLLGAPSYTLQAQATDADSGVQSVEILLNGAVVRPDGGPWTFQPAAYQPAADGSYTIEVRATDNAGNAGRRSFVVYTDRRPGDPNVATPMSPDTLFTPAAGACEPDPEADNDGYCGEGDATSAATSEALGEGDDAAARAAAAAAAHRVYKGISDNKPEIFDDPQYRNLGLLRARLITSWNVMVAAGPVTAAECDALYDADPGNNGTPSAEKAEFCRVRRWMDRAHAAGITSILVSFEHARASDPANPGPPPSVEDYKNATRAFRQAYPQVRWYTAWNEPNQGAQNVATNPYRAGLYWRNLNWQCVTQADGACSVAAGDFADFDNLYSDRTPGDPADSSAYFDRYLAGLKGHRPCVWALHAYKTGRYRQSRRIQEFLTTTDDATPGDRCGGHDPVIWLTEQGGFVHFHTTTTTARFDQTPQEAAADLDYLLDLAEGGSRRITRFYVYSWTGSANCAPDNCFDTGLREAVNQGDPSTAGLRPAYTVFQQHLP